MITSEASVSNAVITASNSNYTYQTTMNGTQSEIIINRPGTYNLSSNNGSIFSGSANITNYGQVINITMKPSYIGIFLPNYGSGLPENGDYSFSTSADRRTLNFHLRSDNVGVRHIVFIIYGNFGSTLNIRYTLTQTLTTAGYGGIHWLNDTYGEMNRYDQWAFNYYNRTNETFSGTYSSSHPLTQCFFVVDSYRGGYAIDGNISNITINNNPIYFNA